MMCASGLVHADAVDGDDDGDFAFPEGDAGGGVIDVDIGGEDLCFFFGCDAVVVLRDDREVKLGAFTRDAGCARCEVFEAVVVVRAIDGGRDGDGVAALFGLDGGRDVRGCDDLFDEA